MKLRIRLLLLFLPLLALNAGAEQSVPKISLLTCGATDEYVFYLYGHTALRVQNVAEGSDLVYNYGHFSPSQKNFIINFMLGKPMYSLGVTQFDYFLYEYHIQGRYIVEQVLHLEPNEAIALESKLRWNALPENSEYKYNFYFDNCATRPRDLIEEFSGGLVYPLDSLNFPTFREAIRAKSQTAGWYTAGADLCLGWKTDQTMSHTDAAFLPELLMSELAVAKRAKDGTPIVAETHQLLPQERIIGEENDSTHHPLWAVLGVALLYGIAIFINVLWREGRLLLVLRYLLYTFLFIGGIVVWFLGLVSEHPHTFPNANMLFLHPFYIALLIPAWRKQLRRWVYLAFFVAIICYLALGYLQVYPLAVKLLALLMLADMWLLWHNTSSKK